MVATSTSSVWVTLTISGSRKAKMTSDRPESTYIPLIPNPTQAQETPAAAQVSAEPSIMVSQVAWDKFTHGAKGAIVMCAVLGVLIIVVASVWFCCGCCGLRKRRRRDGNANRDPNTNTNTNTNGALPLRTMPNGGQATQPQDGGDMPPAYDEVVPPLHQRIAGGNTRMIERSEEDDAVVSDGKTPLSEIPFEDVVLEDVSSTSSSAGSGSNIRHFEQTHHAMGGDTTGHTNT